MYILCLSLFLIGSIDVQIRKKTFHCNNDNEKQCNNIQILWLLLWFPLNVVLLLLIDDHDDDGDDHFKIDNVWKIVLLMLY